jgi:MFS family permease
MLTVVFLTTFWTGAGLEFRQLLLLGATLGIMSLCLFIRQQRYTLYPVIPLKVFRSKSFCVSLFGTLAFGLATAVVLMVPPFFLEKIAQFLPWQVGLVSFCGPLGIVITARISGKYINKVGAQWLMTTGLFIMILALMGLSAIDSNWNPLYFAPLLLVYGMGGGLFQPPNISLIMSAVESEQHGTISSVNRMVHNFGNALGVGVAAALLQKSSDGLQVKSAQGFFYAWLFALLLISFSLVGFIVLLLKDRKKLLD